MNIKKIISVLVSISLLTMNSYVFSTSIPKYGIIESSVLHIDQHIGEIVEKFDGTKTQKIICIEDLHCNPEVQINISKIIKFYKDLYKNKLKFIGVEGSSGKIDVSIFSKIPDKEIKEKVVEEYLQKGYISGAELYSIKYDNNIQLYGIEEPHLYNKNFGLLYRSFSYYDQWQKILKHIEKALEIAKERLAINKLETLINLKQEYISGNISIEEYFKQLINFTQKYSPNNLEHVDQKYPQIAAFMGAIDKKSNINFFVLDKELKIMMDFFNEYLTESQIKKLKDLEVSAKDEYRDYIYKFIKSLDIKIHSDYKETNKFVLYKDYKKRLDEIGFPKEVESFEYDVMMQIAKHREHLRTLLETQRYLNLMKLYFSNNATIYDIRDWQENRHILYEKMDTFGTLVGEIDKFGKYKRLLKHIDKNMDNFYHVAEKRNGVILKNLFKYSTDSPVKIMIIGGYHTNGIVNFLRSKGISFEIVRPNVTKEYNKILYFNRFERQFNWLKKNRGDILKRINQEYGEFKKEALMVMSAFLDKGFNQEVFFNILEEYADKMGEHNANIFNEYIKEAKIDIGLFEDWTKDIDGSVYKICKGEVDFEMDKE